MTVATVITFGYGSFGTVNFLPTLGYGDYGSVTPTGRTKDYSIDGIPIPFTDDAYDSALAALHEKRRQILHEDQLSIDIVIQAVVNRMLK